jgi:hypothetical protein
VTNFKFMEITSTNQYYVHEEVNSIQESLLTFCSPSCVSFVWRYPIQNTKITKLLSVFTYGCDATLVSHHKNKDRVYMRTEC